MHTLGYIPIFESTLESWFLWVRDVCISHWLNRKWIPIALPSTIYYESATWCHKLCEPEISWWLRDINSMIPSSIRTTKELYLSIMMCTGLELNALTTWTFDNSLSQIGSRLENHSFGTAPTTKLLHISLPRPFRDLNYASSANLSLNI